MSLFFNNEEQKMRAYKANLKKEAANQFKQGEKLNEYLLYQKGIETQESGLDKFATAIGEKVGENINVVGKVNKLKSLSGMLVDDAGVSIKNTRAVSKGPKPAAQPPKPKAQTSTNPQIKLAETFDANYKSLFSPDWEASEKAENTAMASEEANTRLSNAIVAAATKREISGMSAEDAISAFRELSDKEDAKIRQAFMNVLDEMADKTKIQKDWELINRLQDLIEKQRLADAFERLEENRILVNDAWANKLQRNLKMLLNEKRANKAIAKQRAQREERLAVEAESKRQALMNDAATTIQKRMAELRAIKAARRSKVESRTAGGRGHVVDKGYDTDATDVGSIADVSFKGRPPTASLEAKRLAKFQELEAMKDKTKNQVKQMTELQRTLFRKPMGLEDKPEHRPSRGTYVRDKKQKAKKL